MATAKTTAAAKKTTAAPKKTTAAKAEPKPVEADVVDNAVEDVVEELQQQESHLFDNFRDRAIRLGIDVKKNVTNEPFILDESNGFSKTIKLNRPKFVQRQNILIMMRDENIPGIIQHVFGVYANYILTEIDKYEALTGVPGEVIVLGIAEAYMTHFYGDGAGSADFLAQ